MKDRVLMAYPPSDIPFLPPYEEFVRLIGLSGGMAGAIRNVAIEMGKVPPDAKTLRKAFREPVTRSVAERMKAIYESRISDSNAIDRIIEEFRPWEELQLRSNGASWLPAIRSFRDLILKDRFPESRAEQFLQTRIDAEYDFLKEIKPVVHAKTRSTADLELTQSALKRLLQHHTFIGKELIEEACEITRSDSGKFARNASAEQRFWQDMRIDFYYNLLSQISLDVLESLNTEDITPQAREMLVTQGFVGSLAPTVDQEGNITFPFTHLLEEWRRVFSGEEEEVLPLRRLADSIPHPSDEQMARLDPATREYQDLASQARETRKTRLKEWRSGVLPKDDQLEGFVLNLVPDQAEFRYAHFRAQLSVIWNRLIKQEVARHRDDGALYQLKEGLLFRYEDIWGNYKDQAAKTMAA
ncbi:hypothetical protein [Marinobacter sp. LN3S78]|uniref:hypothetical protein n=1 Tax=Marinobacter sp. LN3S78 TaxID=3382300 RepID=UPI00387B4C0F